MPVAEPKGARREPEYPPKFRLNLPTVPVLVPRTALELQGRSNGGIWGIYTLPKSGQVNFICGNNDVRTVIEHFIPPQKNFYTPKTNFWLRPWELTVLYNWNTRKKLPADRCRVHPLTSSLAQRPPTSALGHSTGMVDWVTSLAWAKSRLESKSEVTHCTVRAAK